ncbi:MAG: 4-alpha-glucanotransferase [Ignavibacteria bacterium]
MDHNDLLNSQTADKWRRIGVERRAGVALPLFSIFSSNSVGVGEIPDIKSIVDWCCETGMSIIQLLPLNELGSDFSPYNSISTFALEPMYLSLKHLKDADLKPFKKDLKILKEKYPAGVSPVNYGIKNEKLALLKKIFRNAELPSNKNYLKFREDNFHWLKYYCVFKILTDLNQGKSWHEWELKYKYIAPFTSEKIIRNYEDEVAFYVWLQWQIYEQLLLVKKYAKRKKVLIMGDLPFLVSRNSADVWAYKNYFKLQNSAGAPPDMYFARGQRWGMPPYNWDNISADNYSYLQRRLKYAENFYDMYRIDHFVGLFRLWSIDIKSPEENYGLSGQFDPPDEKYWEDHGRSILKVMNESSTMLPCAEDLGTVPECSDKVLEEFGIPGINVQRWRKQWRDNFNFLNSNDYRINSAATISTHDSSSLPAWWENEAGTIDEDSFRQMFKKINDSNESYENIVKKLFEENIQDGRLYWKKEITNVYILLNQLNLQFEQGKEFIDLYLSTFGEKTKFWNYLDIKSEPDNEATEILVRTSLEKITAASSIFSIQLIMEYLYLDPDILKNFSGRDYRINFPGTVGENNWRMVLPIPVEKLKYLEINSTIKEITRAKGRM